MASAFSRFKSLRLHFRILAWNCFHSGRSNNSLQVSTDIVASSASVSFRTGIQFKIQWVQLLQFQTQFHFLFKSFQVSLFFQLFFFIGNQLILFRLIYFPQFWLKLSQIWLGSESFSPNFGWNGRKFNEILSILSPFLLKWFQVWLDFELFWWKITWNSRRVNEFLIRFPQFWLKSFQIWLSSESFWLNFGLNGRKLNEISSILFPFLLKWFQIWLDFESFWWKITWNSHKVNEILIRFPQFWLKIVSNLSVSNSFEGKSIQIVTNLMKFPPFFCFWLKLFQVWLVFE